MWRAWSGMALWAAALCSGRAEAQSGVIRAMIETDETVKAVWAIERRETAVGVYHHRHPGTLTGNRLTIDKLPVPGTYDLRFDFTNGYVEGWSSTVPESDYEEEQPLTEAAVEKIARKMSSDQFTAFGDEVLILDIRGNIQNAALLLMHLRRRPFVGGGYRAGEWVWRVDRWQWEDPDEHTWVPYQERPFYALVRERLYPKDYDTKQAVYARHLGGIVLTPTQTEAVLGTVRIPMLSPGVHAVDSDGTRTRAIRLKPDFQVKGVTP